MAGALDPRETEKAAGVADDAQALIEPEKEQDASAEKKKKKKGMNGFLVSLLQSELGSSILILCCKRVFTFGDTQLYVLECIALLAAIASGVAAAMVNLVMGRFLTLLSDFSFSNVNSMPGNFMSAVQKSA